MWVLVKKTLRILAICVLVFPLSTLAMWQLFLFLFEPPPAPPAAPPMVMDTYRIEGCEKHDSRHPVRDDAGCECWASEIQVVELRVETDAVNYIGHAFLHTPSITCGFLTNDMDLGMLDYLWPLSKMSAGYLRDDREHKYNFVAAYWACPLTINALETSISRHTKDLYQVGNWRGGRNCATWARDRLAEARLPAPPGDCPNKMAWSMMPWTEAFPRSTSLARAWTGGAAK